MSDLPGMTVGHEVTGLASWLALVVLALAATAYTVGVCVLRRRGDAWAVRRSAFAAAGLVVLVLVVLAPTVSGSLTPATPPFDVHVVRHLLMAMAAPLLLALSAPVTLALRSLPRRPRRLLLRVLHSRVAQFLLHPLVVVVLDVGGMYALYLTPMFTQAMQHPLLHAFVHLHMVTAGCLLAWYLVGTDPLPRRPSVRTRLFVLVGVAGAHDVLAKLMYAWTLPATGGTGPQIRGGARLMFYGGDLIDVGLALALLAGWYVRGGRELRRRDRRVAPQLPVVARSQSTATDSARAHRPIDVRSLRR